MLGDDPGTPQRLQGTGRGRQRLGGAATLQPIGACERQNLIAEKKFHRQVPPSLPDALLTKFAAVFANCSFLFG